MRRERGDGEEDAGIHCGYSVASEKAARRRWRGQVLEDVGEILCIEPGLQMFRWPFGGEGVSSEVKAWWVVRRHGKIPYLIRCGLIEAW